MKHISILLLSTMATLACSAATAPAMSISTIPGTDSVVIAAGPSESNDITIENYLGALDIRGNLSRYRLDVSGGCAQYVGEARVFCLAPQTGALTIDLGDRNDRLRTMRSTEVIRTSYVSGGEGDDRLDLEHFGYCVADGGIGSDRLSGCLSGGTYYGGDGRDRIYAERGSACGINQSVFGGAGNDDLVGGHSHDTIFAGAGNDRLRDGACADSMYGEAGRDQVMATQDGQADLVDCGSDQVPVLDIARIDLTSIAADQAVNCELVRPR